MAIEILMPALSPTMEEGNLAKWLKKEGDKVEPGDVIAEIETDKATMEVEAVDEGSIGKIVVEDSTEGVKVNQLIAVLKEEGDTDSEVQEIINKYAGANEPSTLSQNEAAGNRQEAQNKPADRARPSNQVGTRIFASPLARSIADLENVQLDQVQGTGPHGRIIKADIEDYLKSGAKEVGLAPASYVTPEFGRNPQEYEMQNVSTMRKAIAKRLMESKQEIPHFYLSMDCTVTRLLAARKSINDNAAGIEGKKAYKISINDFIIKASAHVLKKSPFMNASWTDQGIKLYNNVDVSVAVALEDGLTTPIIRNADQKSLAQISNEMKMLAEKAKEGKLSPQEYQGGGFSISNLGMYGIKQFNAIVNPPQAAILAVGGVQKVPQFNADNSFKVTDVINFTISCDHRVADGAVAASFLNKLKYTLENPIEMLV